MMLFTGTVMYNSCAAPHRAWCAAQKKSRKPSKNILAYMYVVFSILSHPCPSMYEMPKFFIYTSSCSTTWSHVFRYTRHAEQTLFILLNTSHVFILLTCLALPCLALPCLALPCLALPCLALPCLVLPCLALPCLALPCLALPCLALPCLVLPCLALPCLALPRLFL